MHLYAEGKALVTTDDLEAAFLDTGATRTVASVGGFDVAVVRACRLLVSGYLIQHQDLEFNGLKLWDAIGPSYPDVRYARVTHVTHVS